MQLSYLNLGENQLEGILPESWINLTSVSHCHNSICLMISVAAIHVYVSDMALQLSVLDLRENLLVGTLPESWSHLTSVSHCCYSVHLCHYSVHLQIDITD